MESKSVKILPHVALIGFGAIGTALYKGLHADPVGYVSTVLLPPGPPADLPVGLHRVDDAAALIDARPRLAVECAGQEAVEESVPKLLAAGIDCVLASIGALADERIEAALRQAAAKGGGRLVTIAGAVGGLDALAAARLAGLEEVRYTGRKPPRAWAGSPAEDQFDLKTIAAPTVIFQGNARQAARCFPKNANVAAAVALGGIGFDATLVELIADPSIEQNRHEIIAEGASGRISVTIDNNPLPDNPRTSWLAALSLERTVRDILAGDAMKADPALTGVR